MNNEEKLITIFENILEEYSPYTEPLSLEGEYEIEYIQVESLMNYINNLKQENKELHNKIDKAIEYIEDEGTTFLNFAGQRTWCGKHDADRILKILKDSDVDE